VGRGSPGKPGQTYKALRSELIERLAELEAAGVAQFDETDFDLPDIVAALLQKLPVRAAAATPSDFKERIYVLEGPRATLVSGSKVNKALEDALPGPRFDGERGKLARSGSQRPPSVRVGPLEIVPCLGGLVRRRTAPNCADPAAGDYRRVGRRRVSGWASRMALQRQLLDHPQTEADNSVAEVHHGSAK
jgi:hypothetical protein